jgi:hypothetical protein
MSGKIRNVRKMRICPGNEECPENEDMSGKMRTCPGKLGMSGK